MDNRIAAIIAKHLENLVLLNALKLVSEVLDSGDASREIIHETQQQSELLKRILTDLNSAPPPTSIPEDGADSPAGTLSTSGGASPDLQQREYSRHIRPAATHPVTCHCDWCTENQTDEGMGGDAILDRNVP